MLEVAKDKTKLQAGVLLFQDNASIYTRQVAGLLPQAP